jgi:hypothetical protein
MKKAGIIILLVGLTLTLFTGLNFITREKVVDIGELEISANRSRSIRWSPIIGVSMMAVGVGLYLLGSKRSTSF